MHSVLLKHYYKNCECLYNEINILTFKQKIWNNKGVLLIEYSGGREREVTKKDLLKITQSI